MWIADNGIQVLGGHGFIREHPVELWFRTRAPSACSKAPSAL